jgi:hypothetical protein
VSEPLQPEVLAVSAPLTTDQIRAQLLQIDYGARKNQAMVMAAVSTPIAIYGFARRATWAKTVGVAGLLLAGLAYLDLRRLDRERNTAQRMVLS